MSKIPEYTRKAINKYNDKFDRIAVNLPKGTKQRIKNLTGMSCNKFLSELALIELDRLERTQSAEISDKTDGAENSKPEQENPVNKPDISSLYKRYGNQINDIFVQLEIQQKYGNDVLVQLSEYTKELQS